MRHSPILFVLIIMFLVTPGWGQVETGGNPFQLLPKDIYFQPGGGLRVRYENLRQATGQGFPGNEDESQASHRAHFDFKMYKGEFIETFFRFLNYADWGGATGDSSGGQHDGFTRTNGLLVNQSYGTWKVDGTVDYLRFGRAPLHLGLGYTYGQNDWLNVPYSFDLMEAGWDWETVSLGVAAVKVQEFSTISGQTLSSDPEENHIVIHLQINSPIDALEFVNFNVVQVNRDLGSPDGGTTVLNGLNAQRFALESKLSGKNLFGSAFMTYVAGEEKVASVNVVNGHEKLDVSQTALDLKLGYSFPEYQNLKFWAGYHFDSGDKVAGDGDVQSYDSFFYEVYGQAGLMDFIRWGNLTFVRAGFDLDIFTGFNLGAEWLSLSRTEVADGVRFGEAGRFFQSNIDGGDLVLGDSKDIGNEFDIWVDRQFQSGVNVRVTLSNFFPGALFTQATGPGGAPLASGNTPDSDIFQFLAQVGYSF